MKKNQTSRRAGFTLVEIMIVVAIIGLLAAIAIPYFIKARATSQANACINNLRQIDAAVQQWALETKASSSANISISSVLPYIKLRLNNTLPACPGGGNYNTTTVNQRPTCTLSSTVTPAHILN